jgi:hypothetical protein
MLFKDDYFGETPFNLLRLLSSSGLIEFVQVFNHGGDGRQGKANIK